MSEAPDDRDDRDRDERDQDEPAGAAQQVDLDAIGRDLADVEMALTRLDDGTYFADEVTGEPIPDDLLAANPLARRVG